MIEHPSKKELEQKIVEARSKINLFDRDLSWIVSEEIREFSRAWLNLHAYYGHNDDDITEIHSTVVHSYLDVERKLNLILRNEKHREHYEAALDLLNALEYSMDGIIREGYRHTNPKIFRAYDDEYLDEDEGFQFLINSRGLSNHQFHDLDALAAEIQVKWPDSEPHKPMQPAEDFLRWVISHNSEVSICGLQSDRETISVAADSTIAADVAVWYRSLLPHENRLFCYVAAHDKPFEVFDETTEQEIVAAFSDPAMYQ